MPTSEAEYVVIVPGVARSKYAKSAPKYELNVKQAALSVIEKPMGERNLSTAIRHFYTSGHRVDLDNLLKSVLDGLKGAAYDDDSQIVRVSAERYNITEGFAVEDIRPEEVDLIALGLDFVVITISHL